jgi:hypothetical protein
VTNSDAENLKRDRQGFEALAVILLSLATVGMAWCSYQATVWGSESTKLSIQSAARGRDGSNFRIKANQALTLDIFLFSQYLNAHNASNELLADFYARQFSPELKQAYEAQARSSKFPGAPSDPFTTNLYQTPLLARADALEPESERIWSQSLAAGKAAQQYTLISVLLATALFFSGTAPQFEMPKKRHFVLTLGLAALLIAVGMYIAMPEPPGARSLKAAPEGKL